MKILDKIGMCMSYKGYLFWEEAVMIAKRKRKDKINMENIYDEIAKKYELNPNTVRRDMDLALYKINNLKKKLNVEYDLTIKKALMLFASKQRGEEDE